MGSDGIIIQDLAGQTIDDYSKSRQELPSARQEVEPRIIYKLKRTTLLTVK